MREIKFRAIKRDLANEQFPEIYEKKSMGFIYGTGVYRDTHNTWLILENTDKKTFSQLSANTVEPETVSQYTGLKDRIGKEIYEGDIVSIKHPHRNREYVGPIIYHGYAFTAKSFYFPHHDNPSDPFESLEYMEIIGNIYENPELLREV